MREQERARKTEVFISGLSEYRCVRVRACVCFIECNAHDFPLVWVDITARDSDSHALETVVCVCLCVPLCDPCVRRVATPEDVLVLLQIGGSNRAVRGTDANEASSRSHALLQLAVEVETTQEGGSTVIRRAKLNFVRTTHRVCFRAVCVRVSRGVV